ncbi:hypothetical protein D7319_02340 [Streptomyces radicis]|uniref:Uncharacterized protein n=2 Tax=Streptomyces radicis TaxID=1750517 RepID=A0A3A9WHV6_9ACTN|nr:hypothetical protein D7319_02340 [Streptomyces radicis]RKN27444.1 hypothetical protein D7318_00555 [Streptomyces radicis]
MGEILRHLRMLAGAEAMLMASDDPQAVLSLLDLVKRHGMQVSLKATALLAERERADREGPR